ncbi:DegV family protein with EDD domain [Bacillus tianshenii]|uniref:DegV family protein with EDD domain n=1 Tax=Sutcliffiella tianshenii TaxID=1463404 RepID=A0ABS2P1A4_9BACI|nr:DegV family protein [Bacillus tianshenii]MBM7620661.1 DegV family protein with EDD domain [Bacillus tianshenii]
MTIKIIADSACDLSKDFFNQEHVALIPLKVLFGETEYEDMVTIDSSTVYNAMREGQVVKTSQASPNMMKELFTEIAEKGQTAIYIAFSSELSGTYQTAVLMRQEVMEDHPNLDLTIIDSKCASLGLGLVVKHAAELAENGSSKEDILAQIAYDISHMEHVFTVDNLDYLARGGRVSKASAFVGGLLNIKPLLHMEDGKLIPLEKIRGRKKVLRRMFEVMKERNGFTAKNQRVGISHGDDEVTAIALQEMIQESSDNSNFTITTIGSAVGAHAGPGTIALFFLNDDKA